MISIPKRTKERIISGIKRFQPILESAKARDVNESDTVIIVTDILAEVFGYDKYSEITSEFSIRSTYCDLATKIDGKLQSLIEVKAIGSDLKDNFIKQATDYAANQGADWVVLTNGIVWKFFKVTFAKPIDQELVLEIDFLSLNPKINDNLELIYFFTKEGWLKDCLEGYHAQRQALNRFFLGTIILGNSVVELIRRELRKISPDVKVDANQIRNVISQEVLKRDVVEGEKVEEAKKTVSRILNKAKSKAKPTNKIVEIVSPVSTSNPVLKEEKI